MCFVSSFAFPPYNEMPGLQRHTWAIANGLAERGVHVSIISVDAKYVVGQPNITSYRIRRLPRIANLFGLNWLQMSEEAFLLYTQRLTGDVDIINVQEACGIRFSRNKRILKSKLVAFYHGMHGSGDIWDHLIWRPFVLPLQKDVCRGADWVFAATQPELIRRCFQMKSDNITQLYNGADQKEFDEVKRDRSFLDSVKRKFGVDNFRTLLYVGSIMKRKRVHLLIEAFRALLHNYPYAKLLIVGPEVTGQEKYMEYCRGRCQGANISMLGYVEERELIALYQLADVFVLPSEAEGLPQALMESLMGGAPVVVPDSGAIRSLVEENKVGYTFDPTTLNENELRAKIELCLSNLRELRENVTRNRSNFGWDVTIKKILTVYDRLLQAC